MNHDMHNHWNFEDKLGTLTRVSLNVSNFNINICIDDKIIFNQDGEISDHDVRLIKFIAQGIADHFNTELTVTEKADLVN